MFPSISLIGESNDSAPFAWQYFALFWNRDFPWMPYCAGFFCFGPVCCFFTGFFTVFFTTLSSIIFFLCFIKRSSITLTKPVTKYAQISSNDNVPLARVSGLRFTECFRESSTRGEAFEALTSDLVSDGSAIHSLEDSDEK